jgi:hypothetical protein
VAAVDVSACSNADVGQTVFTANPNKTTKTVCFKQHHGGAVGCACFPGGGGVSVSRLYSVSSGEGEWGGTVTTASGIPTHS